ncbi:hypothetical protein pb186bvf_013585 [Paramecium bursaria]
MNSLSPQRERFLYSQEKKLEDMNCIISNGSIGSIFLGNIESACKNQQKSQIASQEYLKRHNIGAVLSICMNKIPSQVAASLQYYQHIYLEDAENEQISRYFDQAFNFIEKAKQSTSVLVHCVAGISRSATLLASYLMRKNQISAKEALLQLERKRWQVYPNNGFLRQLTEFEKQVLKKETNLQTPVKMNNSDFLSNYSSPLNFTPQRKENNNQGLQSLEYQRIRKKYLDEPSSEIKSRGLEINLNFRKQTSDYLITTPELPRKSLFNDDLHKKQNSQGSIKDFNQKKKEILDTCNLYFFNNQLILPQSHLAYICDKMLQHKCPIKPQSNTKGNLILKDMILITDTAILQINL